MLTRLSAKVLRNSIIPTAKIVRYSSVPVGVSPRLTCTMYAVMVSIGTVGSRVSRGCCPAAIARIMVSPIARDTPNNTDAAIPDSADGTTTFTATCNLDEPRAYAPSRKLWGTAYMASSDRDEIIGMIMMPITIPGASALNPETVELTCCNNGVTNNRAKYPYTTVGMPANTSKMGLTTLRTCSPAYSLKYSALTNPIGSATRIAIPAVSAVQVISGRMPKCLSAKSGVHCVSVRNSKIETSRKNSTVSTNRTTTMPNVVTIERDRKSTRLNSSHQLISYAV